MKFVTLGLLLVTLLAGFTGIVAMLQPEIFLPTSRGSAAELPSLPPEVPALTTTPEAGPASSTATPTLEVAPPTETSIPSDPPPTPTPTPYLYVQGPSYFPDNINPLTGLPVADPKLLERRPIVIKVTNFPRSVRPQWGLSQADHIYEYYIGDHMSRFIGIFYGQDASRVGPIRSARLFDEHILRMYRGVFVFGWADDPILEFLLVPDLKPFMVVERPENCPPVCRIGPEYAYNTLFTDTAQIGAYLDMRRADNTRQDLTGLRFEMQVPKSGHPAQTVSVHYSSISYHTWNYEPELGRYLRQQETSDDTSGEKTLAPLVDSLTEQQLAADNLLLLMVPHSYYYKSTSTEIIDQTILGSGNGYALRDGQLYPIEWEQSANDQLFTFHLPNGRIYPLKPGNLWIEILSLVSSFTPGAEPGEWEYSFQMPEYHAP